MAEICSVKEAVAEIVRDGDTIVAEGFSHLVPFAAGHEIIRQRRRDLTLVRMSSDLLFDQMVGAGCARKLVFSWAGNPGVGLLHRFRDAVENGWPHPLEIEEHSHAGLATAFVAGASGLPFGVLRGYTNDLRKHTMSVAPLVCPFTGTEVMAVRAITPDVAVIHAQQADREGNVLLWGVTGIQKEAVLASKRSIVTVEEILGELPPAPRNSVVLPSWAVTAVARAPGGARPSYAHGYYPRNDEFYRQWDSIARDRNSFLTWMEQNVEQSCA
jgi:glutaconate CoA-transferase, subunit A